METATPASQFAGARADATAADEQEAAAIYQGYHVPGKECPDRSHITISEAGWEEVADYALDWATRNALGRRAGPCQGETA